MSVLQLPDDPEGFRRQNGLLIPWPQVVSEIVPSIRPNEHVTFLGRTGWGKSWLMRHLLELVAGKRRVTLIDCKQSDPLWRDGFKTYKNVPNWMEKKLAEARRDQEERREWVRVAPTMAKLHEARLTVNFFMSSAYRWGSTVLVFDEVKAITEPAPCLGLKRQANVPWQWGRARRCVVWAGTQSPVWLPRTALDEMSHVFVGRINDLERLRRIAEIGGKELADLVPKLKKYQFAYRNLTDDTLGVIQAPATMAGGAIAQRAAGEWTRSRRFQALYGGD